MDVGPTGYVFMLVVTQAGLQAVRGGGGGQGLSQERNLLGATYV